MPPRASSKGAVRVGPFVILDEIGQGGQARLFRAKYLPDEGSTQVVPVDRGDVVVLKVMRQLADAAPEEAEVFSKEADLLVMLDHPGIVRALTRGMHGGRVWTALEYVEGEDLGNFYAAFSQAELRMRPDVLATLMHDFAEALAAAHAMSDPRGRPMGLVHRDICPRNVIVDVAGQIRLIDFGASVLTASEQSEQIGVIGTPGYLAPEAARMEALTPAADVYSAGIMFYELLCGRRAFPVENQPDDAIIRTHTAGLKPKWPTQMALPPEIVDVIDVMLSADPGERPQDGAELFHLVAPLVRDLDSGRYALSLVVRDLLRSNSDRPPPLFIQPAA